MIAKYIYLGDNKESIACFKKFLGDDFSVAKHRVEVLRTISAFDIKKNETLVPVLLLQKNYLPDYSRVTSIKTFFPNTFIILVTDKLEKEESAGYLKLGVNNTIPPVPTQNSINDCINFIHQFYKIVSTPLLFKDNVNIFILPAWKRIFDILASSMGLLLLSPLLIIVAIAIVVEDGFPIIYKSKRVGSNFHIFDFIKFRSMYKDADKRIKDMSELNQYSKDEPELDKGEILLHEDFDTSDINVEDPTILFDDNFVIDEKSLHNAKAKEQDEALSLIHI